MFNTGIIQAIIALVVVATTLPAIGQQPDSTVWLPEVIVSDSRIPISSRESTARVTTIVLDEATGFVQDLGQLLTDHTGISVRDYGPAGLSTLSIRGGTASHVGIIYNGIPLVNAQLGEFDLSLFGMSGIESVQVVHGSGSSWLGGHAASGLIMLEPARHRKTGSTVTLSAGSFGQMSTAVNAFATHEDVAADISYTYRKSDGDFRFVDETRFPVETVRRANANQSSHELLAVVTLPRRLPGIGISVVASERGLPGSVGTARADEQQDDTNYRLWASESLRWGKLLSTTKVSYQNYRLRYINPGQDINDLGIASTSTAEEALTWSSRTMQVVAGGMVSRLSADHPALVQVESETSSALFVAADVQTNRVQWSGSLRYDRYGRSGLATESVPVQIISPRTGVNISIVPSGDIRLKASAGRSSSVPTFNDRFWSGVGARGNPDLKPEKGWSTDVGVFAGKDSWSMEVTGFLSRMQDRISWAPGDGSVWTPSNIGEVQSNGLESSVAIHESYRGVRMNIRLFHTLTRAINKTEHSSASYGKQLRYIPRQSGSYSVKLSSGNNMLSVDGQFASQRFVTADESSALSRYQTVDVALARLFDRWGAGISLTAGINNVLNKRYSLVGGYPMPGRNYNFAISINV